MTTYRIVKLRPLEPIPPRQPLWRRLAKSRLTHVAVTLVLLGALYYAADWRAVGGTLLQLQPRPLALAMLLFIPQIIVSAARWRWLAHGVENLSLGQAIRRTLAASALNLVLPSKIGDFSRCFRIDDNSDANTFELFLRAIVEKVFDVALLAGLVLWGLVGGGWSGLITLGLALVVYCLVSSRLFAATGGNHSSAPSKFVCLFTWTLGLWLLHMWQLDFLLRAAGVEVASSVAFARIPLAIFAGLVPLGMLGIGPRDMALVWLFNDVASSSTMAAVGMLTALRYVVPGVCGVGIGAVTATWEWVRGKLLKSAEVANPMVVSFDPSGTYRIVNRALISNPSRKHERTV